jgi:uncharacterized protein YbjT (DUF2867 family)
MTTIVNVSITGATGFVGAHVVRALVGAGYRVRALVRDRAKARRVLPEGIETVVGEALDTDAVDALLAGSHACINLIGIIRESGSQTFERTHVQVPRLLVARSKAIGVRRFVHMSALGVRDTGVSNYQRTKWEGEVAVRRSGLDWTIFRPGLIHGPEGEFVRLARGWCSGHHAPYFFLPYFSREERDLRVPLGSVRYYDPRVQPVDVRDVAEAFARCLKEACTHGEVYNLVGSEVLTMPELLRHMRDNLPGANIELEPHGIPAEKAAKIARLATVLGLGSMFPFDEGMARMAAEDQTGETRKVETDLGLRARGFRQAFAEYAPNL